MNRNTLIALGAFALLGLVTFLSSRGERERGMTRVTFAGIDSEAISKLEFAGKYAFSLEKRDGTWVTDSGKRVEISQIDRALSAIVAINSSDFVTDKSERFADLEVDDEKGTRVKVFAGNAEVANFVIGKAARSGTHIRSGDDVYAVGGFYGASVAKEKSAWLDKALVAVKPADLAKVEVKLAGQSPYALTQADGKWSLADAASVLPEGFRFDADAAARLVTALTNLRAVDLPDAAPDAAAAGLGQEADLFVLHGKEADGKPGTVLTLRLGKATDEAGGSHYVQVEGSSDVATVAATTLKGLRKLPSDFRDLKLVQLDAGKVTKLEIKGSEQSLLLEKKGADWSVAKSSEKVPDDFKLDAAAVSRRISAIASARALALAPAETSRAAAGLTAPKASITAVLDDGSRVSVQFGSDTKHDEREAVYVVGTIDAAIYVAGSFLRNNLTGGLTTFAAHDAPPGLGGLDPESLKNLPPEIRQQLMQQMMQQQQQQRMMQQVQAQQGK